MIDIVDKINRLEGLLHCFRSSMKDKELHGLNMNPPDYLFMQIMENLTEIENRVREEIER